MIFTSAFLFIFQFSSAQTEQLENNYRQSMDSSEHYLKIDPAKSLSSAISALEISRVLKDEEKLAKSYLQIGIIYRLNGNLSRSAFHLKKALALGKNFDFYPIILKETGITLKQQSRFDEALQKYLEALKIFEEKKMIVEMAGMKNNIGRLYFAMGDSEKALSYYRNSLQLRSETDDFSSGVAYHNIGAVMEKRKFLDSARYYYRKALDLYKQKNDQVLIAYGYASLGNILNNKDSAEYYLLKSHEIRSKLKLESDLLESLFYLANFRMKNNQRDQAILLFAEVYDKCVRLNKHQYAYESAEKLSEMYRFRNDFAQAYLYEKYASQWKDSLYQQEKKVKELGFDFRLNELEQKRKMEALNKRNKSQNKMIRASQAELEKEKQWRYFWFVIILLVVLFSIVILYFFISQRKQNRLLQLQKNLIEQKNKENEILVREVHHRVKNNLHSVMSLLRLEKRKLKDKSTDTLVENMENRMMNISFIHEILYNQSDLTTIPLKEYFSVIGNKIFTFYPEKKIKLEITGDISVDADKALYLGQLFAELFTNSCKHAFSNTEIPEIKISLQKNNPNSVNIKYRDNGPGIVKGTINESFGKKLIESHGRKLNARVDEYSDNGYVCTIEFEIA